MKTNLKTVLASLGLLALASTAVAAPYSQPYTASFGTSLTGQAANVVFYVFDAAGVCRVGPASYVNAAGATVTGPNNEPTSMESRDYTGTGGTGAYFIVLPLDSTWGALHIKAVITGQAGVVAEGSLVNRGPDVVDGYTPALPGTLTNGQTVIQGQETANGTAISGVAPAVWTQSSRTVTGGTVSLSNADEAALGLIPGISTVTGKLTFDTSSILYADAKYLPATVPAGYGGGTPPSDYLNTAEKGQLALASTAQQAGQPVTLPSTVLSAADILAVQQAIMTYALHTGVSYQKAVAQIYLTTSAAVAPTKSGTVSTNPFKWPDGTTGQTSTLDSSTNTRTETPGTLPN